MKAVTLIYAVSVRFENGFEIPKQTERVDCILSEKILKQNRNCQYFVFFQFEPNPFRRQDILMAYHVLYSTLILLKVNIKGHPISSGGQVTF